MVNKFKALNKKILAHHWILAQRKSYTYPSPMVYALGVIYSDTMRQPLKGVCFELTIMLYRNGLGHWFATTDSIAKLNQQAAQLIRQDPTYTRRIIKKFKQLAPKLLKFTREQIFIKDCSRFSNQKLWQLYERYLALYDEIYTWGEPLVLGIQETLTEELKEYLLDKLKKRQATEYLHKYFNLLISPLQASFVKKEERDLLKIALAVEAQANLKELLVDQSLPVIKEQLVKYPHFNRSLSKHTRRYCWVPYDYGVYLWDKEFFLQTLIDTVKTGRTAARLQEQAQYYKALGQQQRDLVMQLRINRYYQQLFRSVRDCAFLLDFKKELFTQSHYHIKSLLEEIGVRFGISKDLVQFYLPQELKRALLQQRKLSQARLRRRFKKFAIFWAGRQVKIYEGKHVDVLWKFLNGQDPAADRSALLDGVIASAGKAVGTVKVVLDPKEIGKVNQGDILVAAMTSPDYLLGIRKAAAIITDEGGVTCHAAIVSREFGIPCVIGTKIATQVLKDGDQVEVNANHGSVKIIPLLKL